MDCPFYPQSTHIKAGLTSKQSDPLGLLALRRTLLSLLLIFINSEQHIHIGLNGIYLLHLFLEPCPLIVKPLLFFCKTLLFGLQCF